MQKLNYILITFLFSQSIFAAPLKLILVGNVSYELYREGKNFYCHTKALGKVPGDQQFMISNLCSITDMEICLKYKGNNPGHIDGGTKWFKDERNFTREYFSIFQCDNNVPTYQHLHPDKLCKIYSNPTVDDLCSKRKLIDPSEIFN